MKKTVLITGATGYLGRIVTRDLIESKKYNVHILSEDINNSAALERHASSHSEIDVIIHMAALVASHQGLEREVIQTNYTATKDLARLYEKAHFIFLSSDYVFDGESDILRNVGDKKSPQTAYGVSKSLSEDFLLNEFGLDKITILRTSMLYGYSNPKRNNFLKFLHDNLISNNKVEVFKDVYSRPTHVKDLSSFILDVVDAGPSGIIHASSREYVNRYELSKIFCKIHGYSTDYLIPIPQPPDGRIPKKLNMNPSEIFIRQIQFSLEDGIKTCLRKFDDV